MRFFLWCLKVHITQGDQKGRAMIVSWVTMEERGSDEVVYWKENSKEKRSAKGKMSKYKYHDYTSGYIHHCTIKNLEVRFLSCFLIHFYARNWTTCVKGKDDRATYKKLKSVNIKR